MQIINTKIVDVKIIKPTVYSDQRGYFFESFNKNKYESFLINNNWIQDNESCSKLNTLRGLHYQIPPYTQAKLVRVIKGKVFDIAVDIRKDSPTFGQYVSIILSDENKYQFYIPRGFAHGFLCLTDNTIFSYKCDNCWNKQSERGILYNDKFLNIKWPETTLKDFIISDKDLLNSSFKEAEVYSIEEFNK